MNDNSKSILIPNKALISIKEARKILGKEAKTLSDKEITQILAHMEKMAEIGLKIAQDRKSVVV